MKYCFIINPASGKAATKEGLEERILDRASYKGLDATVLHTGAVGDTQRFIASFARQNAGEDIRFYVCGGDGTICEAVNGIMALPDRTGIHLGVIPVGTGNDFVRNFDNKELFLDIESQLDAVELDVDLLKCNDTYCINMINIGFDCQVVVKTAKIKRHHLIPSKLAYIFGLVGTLVKKPGVAMKIAYDGHESEHDELLLTTFANGSFCGGGFYSNPKASLCDGKIDALFVNDISRTKFVSIVGKYKSGTHLDGSCDSLLHSSKAQSYSLVFDSPTEISLDGEIMRVDRADICCIGEAISILVPKGCSYAAAPALV